MDDDGVAVDHDEGGQNEHDDQLIPGEYDTFVVVTHVTVAARHHRHVARVVVVHVRSGALKEEKGCCYSTGGVI